MSLISDALKKAERDRRKADAGEPVAAPPPPSTPIPEAPEPPRAPKSNTLMIGLVAGAVAVIAGAAYFIFAGGNSTPSEPAPKVAQAPAGNAMTKEPKVSTEPQAPSPAPVAVAPVRRAIAEAPPAPAPVKVDTSPPLAKPVVKADASILNPPLAPAFNAPPQVSSLREEQPPPAQTAPVITPAPALQPPAPKPSPVVATPAPEPIVVAAAPTPKPVAPAPDITPAPIVASAVPPPAPVIVAAPAPAPVVVSPPPPAPTPAVAAKPAPNPAAQTFVDQIVLGGVRLGGVQLILIKGAVYKPGDPVNADLKLKLLSVQPHDITFADESGFQYHKRY